MKKVQGGRKDQNVVGALLPSKRRKGVEHEEKVGVVGRPREWQMPPHRAEAGTKAARGQAKGTSNPLKP